LGTPKMSIQLVLGSLLNCLDKFIHVYISYSTEHLKFSPNFSRVVRLFRKRKTKPMHNALCLLLYSHDPGWPHPTVLPTVGIFI